MDADGVVRTGKGNGESMNIEQRNGYTIIDRRGGEPCRVCCSQDCHSREYNKPTMECIKYLRGEIARLLTENARLSILKAGESLYQEPHLNSDIRTDKVSEAMQ